MNDETLSRIKLPVAGNTDPSNLVGHTLPAESAGDLYAVDQSVDPWELTFTTTTKIIFHTSPLWAPNMTFTVAPSIVVEVARGQWVHMWHNGSWWRIAEADHRIEKVQDVPSAPISLNGDYKFVIIYAYPGPLPCGGVSSTCSDMVDGGPSLGRGRFCDYLVLCAGATVSVFYNRFEPGA